MHEPLFAQTVIPEPRVICKLQMRHYSLGHELFLFRRQNPLLLLSPEEFNALSSVEQIQAILGAADICSQTWRELNFRPQTWREQFRVRRIWKKWNRALRRENYPLQIAEFRNYLAAARTDFPGQIPADSEGDTRYIGAPEILRLYQFICQNIPASEIAFYSAGHASFSAWDYPYGLARMQMSVHLETEGAWSIYNWQDKCHDQYVAEREAARAAKGEKDAGITIHPADPKAETVPPPK